MESAPTIARQRNAASPVSVRPLAIHRAPSLTTLEALPPELQNAANMEAGLHILGIESSAEKGENLWLHVSAFRQQNTEGSVFPIDWNSPTNHAEPWNSTRIARELRAWMPAWNSTDIGEAAEAAARLLALRHWRVDPSMDSDSYLPFEAQQLRKIARIANNALPAPDAWRWLVDINARLHTVSDLPRPNAARMMQPAPNAIPRSPWRGEGQLLERAEPPFWQEHEDQYFLRLVTSTGVRHCNSHRCTKTLEERLPESPPPPSLRHAQSIDVVGISIEEGTRSILLSSAARQLRCEREEICAKRCSEIALSDLQRTGSRRSPSYAQLRGADDSSVLAPMKFCAPNTALRTVHPLFWHSPTALAVATFDGLESWSLHGEGNTPLPIDALSEVQRQSAGISHVRGRYALTVYGGELAVWLIHPGGKTPLPLEGLSLPSKHLSNIGWAVESPDGRRLAVAYGGQLLGVWELFVGPIADEETSKR